MKTKLLNKKNMGGVALMAMSFAASAEIVGYGVVKNGEKVTQSYTITQQEKDFKTSLVKSVREIASIEGATLYSKSVTDPTENVSNEYRVAQTLGVRVLEKEYKNQSWRLILGVDNGFEFGRLGSSELENPSLSAKKELIKELLKRADGTERTLKEYIAEEKRKMKRGDEEKAYHLARLMFFDYVVNIRDYVKFNMVGGRLNAYIDKKGNYQSLKPDQMNFEVNTKPIKEMVNFLAKNVKRWKGREKYLVNVNSFDRSKQMKFHKSLGSAADVLDDNFFYFVNFVQSSGIALNIESAYQKFHYELLTTAYATGVKTKYAFANERGPYPWVICQKKLVKENPGIGEGMLYAASNRREGMHIAKPVGIRTISFMSKVYDPQPSLLLYETEKGPASSSIKTQVQSWLQRKKVQWKLDETVIWDKFKWPRSCNIVSPDHLNAKYFRKGVDREKADELEPWLNHQKHLKNPSKLGLAMSTTPKERVNENLYLYTNEKIIANGVVKHENESLSPSLKPYPREPIEDGMSADRKVDILIGLLKNEQESYEYGVRHVEYYKFASKVENLIEKQ